MLLQPNISISLTSTKSSGSARSYKLVNTNQQDFKYTSLRNALFFLVTCFPYTILPVCDLYIDVTLLMACARAAI